MYVDIVISNIFNLNKHFFSLFLFSLLKGGILEGAVTTIIINKCIFSCSN